MVEGSDVVCATRALLNGANATFDVRNMFIFATDVELRLECGSNITAGALEFRVSKDVLNPKATFAIDAVNVSESLGERGCFTVGEGGDGDEPNVPRDRHEERNLVHKHDVYA